MHVNSIKLFLIVLCFLSSCSSTAEQKKLCVRPVACSIVSSDGTIQPAVSRIIRLLGYEDIPSRVDLFVSKFFPIFARKGNVERWDVIDVEDTNKRKEILNLFENLGFFKEVTPEKKEYEYIILLGATLSRMRMRLATLKACWLGGVRANKIVFLTGARPLERFEGPEQIADYTQKVLPIKEGWVLPKNHPQTEADAFRILWDQADLPSDLLKIPVEFIDAPMKQNDDGRLTRPNTGDTVVAWMSSNPAPGNCLVLTNQPYVGYQDAAVCRLMKKNFIVETVGTAAGKENQNVLVLVDTLIRWLAIESYFCGFFDAEKLQSILKQ